MGSIIRNPSPYPWHNYNPNKRPNKGFIVVVHQGNSNSEVVHLIESDSIPSEKLENRFLELVRQYPWPTYEIMLISLPEISDLCLMLLPDDNFAGVQIEKVTD